MRYLLFLAIPLYLLDQATKWLVQHRIPYGQEIPIISGFFSLVNVSNTGAAFSLLEGNNLLFSGLAVVAILVVLWLLLRPAFTHDAKHQLTMLTQIALSLLLAGVAGNLTDRLFKGSVVDFLHFYYQQYAWPSFNVADSCICVAAALLILGSFKSGPQPAQNEVSDKDTKTTR